jgi:hypothetical protein
MSLHGLLQGQVYISFIIIIIIIIIVIIIVISIIIFIKIIVVLSMFYSNPGLVMWDLWWTKWRWNGFSPSTSVSPANLHSINFSTITITYHPGLVK